jgi:hypothetical protein
VIPVSRSFLSVQLDAFAFQLWHLIDRTLDYADRYEVDPLTVDRHAVRHWRHNG